MSGGILPGMNETTVNRQQSKNRMQSNIFGLDDSTKIEFSRTSIGHDVISNGPEKVKKVEIIEDDNRDEKTERIGSIPVYLKSSKTKRFSFYVNENKEIKYQNCEERVDEKFNGCFITNGLIPLIECVTASNADESLEILQNLDKEFVKHGVTKMIVPLKMMEPDQYAKLYEKSSATHFYTDIIVIPVADQWLDNMEALQRISTGLKNNFIQVYDKCSHDTLEKLMKFSAESGQIPFFSVNGCKNELQEVQYVSELSLIAIRMGIPLVITNVKYNKTLELIEELCFSRLNVPIRLVLSMHFELDLTSEKDTLRSLIESTRILGLNHVKNECMVKLARKYENEFGYSFSTMIKLFGRNFSEFLGLENHVLSEGVIWKSDSTCKVVYKNQKVIFTTDNGHSASGKKGIYLDLKIDENDYFKISRKHLNCKESIIERLQKYLGEKNSEADQKEEKKSEDNNQETPNQEQLNSRRGTRRNMHVSSFSLSGAQADDHIQQRTSIRTKLPPGGGIDTRLW